MKKVLIFAGVVLLLVVAMVFLRFILGGPEDGWLCTDSGWAKHGNPSVPMPDTLCGENKKLIGGDKDEHGCIGPAGYAWCPSAKKCQRMWEEYCEEYKDQFRGEVKPDKSNLIQVDNIKSGESIKSPLVVTGQARGTWFSEGSFPLILTDWDGKIIAESQAQFQGEEWMTENFVPFKGTIEFTKPNTTASNRGTLILKKDNPSGQSELDDALEIPIIFE